MDYYYSCFEALFETYYSTRQQMNQTSTQLILPLAPADRRVKRRGIAVIVGEMSPLTCCGYFWPPGVASSHCIQQVSPFRRMPSSLTVAALAPSRRQKPTSAPSYGAWTPTNNSPSLLQKSEETADFSSAAGEEKIRRIYQEIRDIESW